jgi:UTP--glucose-1-phosphate uridylyltransferase
LGLGHAILMAESFAGKESFAVLLPDDIYDCPSPCTKQLIEVHKETQATVIVLGRVDEEGTKKYGIIKPKKISERLFQVEDMVEKPGPEKAFSDLGILGRYVFNPEIFDAIKKTPPDYRGEIQITDAIRIEATISLALKRPEFSQHLREYLQSFKVQNKKSCNC